ncbi:MAG: DDE-type integrase/transposase/recombinase [Candidatus Caldarchaeum sp.]
MSSTAWLSASPASSGSITIVLLRRLSFRDVSERYASREGVGEWVHRLGRVFNSMRKPRRLVAVDETVEKRLGEWVYVWSAVDVDAGEIIAVYASRGRSMLNALTFLRMVLRACEGKPVVVVDRGPWYPWVLKGLGIEYFHETFGNRNRIERWFRELKDRTRRFYNNINSKTVKSIEEIAAGIAPIHNLLLRTQTREGGVIPS